MGKAEGDGVHGEPVSKKVELRAGFEGPFRELGGYYFLCTGGKEGIFSKLSLSEG